MACSLSRNETSRLDEGRTAAHGLDHGDTPHDPAAEHAAHLIAISVAPLGLVGIVATVIPTPTPLDFVASLGVIALAGMIIRNSVIMTGRLSHPTARSTPT